MTKIPLYFQINGICSWDGIVEKDKRGKVGNGNWEVMKHVDAKWIGLEQNDGGPYLGVATVCSVLSFVFLSLKVTPKSDVYCLGIVILEVVTGKFPLQYLNNGNGGTDVVQWDQMWQLLHIGVACADSNPKHRITLREVIRRIEEIPTSSGEGALETRTTESMPSLRDGYADQIEEGRGVAVVRDGAEVR
nr:pollen receptor-like kinase 3 [Ipomoea batatas]